MDLGYSAFRYAFKRASDGTLIRINTTVKTRIYMMASIMNSMLQAGYSNDQIDWYAVNRYLALTSDNELETMGIKPTTITSFYGFQRLYAQIDTGKTRHFEGTIDCDDNTKRQIAIRLNKRNADESGNRTRINGCDIPFTIESNAC